MCLQIILISSAWNFCVLEPLDETNQFNEMVLYSPGKSDGLLNRCSDCFDLINQISVFDSYSWVDDKTVDMIVITEVILDNKWSFNSWFLLTSDKEFNTKMMSCCLTWMARGGLNAVDPGLCLSTWLHCFVFILICDSECYSVIDLFCYQSYALVFVSVMTVNVRTKWSCFVNQKDSWDCECDTKLLSRCWLS